MAQSDGVMHFEFPLPLNLANSRMHWRMKHRKKLAYWELLDALVMAKKIPKAPATPIVKPEAHITMRTWRRCDTDGAHSRLKWTFDFLETRGYIVNDRDLIYH